MRVRYTGPALDFSGYGEATRHHLGSLNAVKIDTILNLVRYTPESSDFGSFNQLVQTMMKSEGDYHINLIHTTPDQFTKYIVPGKYNIGFMYWETDRIPDEFAAGLNLCDEIWTASKANESAIIKAKVTKKVTIIPQSIQTDCDWGVAYEIPGFPAEHFLFYSIFEWTDRKNPLGLLNAYWREFQNNEPVGLLLKTYFRNFTSQNKRQIRSAITHAKSMSGLRQFPPVYLYLDLMDRSQVMRLHKTGNCFVSAHRGEGWGVPQVEAALAGNPIISTGYGGCHEYFTNQKNALILPYEMTPLHGMAHSSRWYTPQQNWADPDINALRKSMRFAYEEQKKLAKIAKAGQKLVMDNFNLEAVGTLIANRLKEIEYDLP